MALLSRVHQKIFGTTGGTGEFGAFGSDSLGSAVTTKDLATIQSLAPFDQGLFAATNNSNEPPRIQDINSLYLLFTSQLSYYFQNGMPEWHASQEYKAVLSYCQKGGILYRAVQDMTVALANLNKDPATDDGTFWEAGDASLRQLKWDLDTLGFTGYALYTDKYLMDKLRIARSHFVGETIFSPSKDAAVKFGVARSTALPSNAEYFPVVDRSIDNDIAVANYPLLVAKLYAKKMKSSDGTTDFTVTVSGSNVTFPNTTPANQALNKVQNDALVAGFLNSSQTATYSADYSTATTQRTINIAGTDYVITSCTLATRVITVTGSPATGSQTAYFGTHHIAGSTTSVRLHKLSGFVPVASGDSDGEYDNEWRKMDRMQGHKHSATGTVEYTAGTTAAIAGGSLNALTLGTYSATVSIDSLLGPETVVITVGNPTTDGTDGTPRTGKTTDPRGFGQTVYTFAGVYI